MGARVVQVEGSRRYRDVVNQCVVFDVQEVLQEVVECTKRDVEVVVVDDGEAWAEHLEHGSPSYDSVVTAHERAQSLGVLSKPVSRDED